MYDEIYLIDDDALVNQIHTLHFSKIGVKDKLKVYTNPEDAFKELRDKKSLNMKTLILLDINMPEMSGFEFLEAMTRDNFPHRYDVLIVTSSEAKADRDRATEFKKYVRAFIPKPLQREHLKRYL
tara:strand:+ start:557 stop:931 length:375 start_codon:yes stop_codon:yes gene_type:complete